ncbi:hypothetical protein BDV34DRAFT_231199 [Aspergillus parasiticus]|uniref:Uncharacterized protein n=1 Tax=Aspergillus parasiticus TaxID=5067 RepID=A0A5N6D2L1_ASPPA|nr:hypothetical protein BDV34DRAFT_231199 [Aspergillus parasiticus]
MKKDLFSSSRDAIGLDQRLPGQVDENVFEVQHCEVIDSCPSSPSFQRSKRQSLRRHCAKFRWFYILGVVVVLSIMLPVFFLVILRAIVQRILNQSNLVLTSADIMNPRPHSVNLTINSTLHLPVDIPVRIDPLTLNLGSGPGSSNSPFAQVYIPGTTVGGTAVLGVQSQTTQLNNQQWLEYVRSMIFEETVVMSVVARVNTFLGILKSNVVFNKEIEQKGLNSFSGFSIQHPRLLLPAADNGTNFIATVSLRNPSVMTLEIGTVVLDLKISEGIIGNATLKGLIIQPGNQSTPLYGILDLQSMKSNAGTIIKSQSNPLKNGYLLIDSVVKLVTYDGVEVPYYTDAMHNLTMTAKLPLVELGLDTLGGIMEDRGIGLPFLSKLRRADG